MGKKLNLEWVSDVIGDDYKSWGAGDTIIIQKSNRNG